MTDATRIAVTDRFGAARAVADAVLYEGYVLYPYRASARKNQIRWQFGVLAPKGWAEAEGSERWANRTEVLVDPGQAPVLRVRVRWLQVQERQVEAPGVDGRFESVDALPAAGVTHVPFAEAVEHEIDVPPLALLPLAGAHAELPITVDAASEAEPILGDDGNFVGRAVRRREAIAGRVRIATEWAAGTGALLKVVVAVENTVTDHDPAADRDAAMRRSLVAVHTLLAVDDATFVSLLDPPAFAAEAAGGCRSDGTYPVLVGPPGSTDATADVVLSSPIILYDHPAVAPESQGDMFDATEIDEILALRVLTLTDDEKAEARGTDARAAAIVERCDDLPPELWARLHGTIRSLSPSRPEPTAADPGAKPWWDPGTDAAVDPFTDATTIAGEAVGRGTQVVLRPSRRADAHDMFLAGQPATVAGVFHDVDGAVHLAVTLDDDPAAELYGSTGRFYYFTPEEVELR
jgi:hypothetical protein